MSRSRSTGRVVLRRRQQVLALARRPSWILGSGGGACAPAGRGWVGVHSTNFSPISDCGRIVQLASCGSRSKPGWSMRRTTAAFWSGVTSSDSILPTLTPAILTSSPGITENALSKIARTL